MALEVETVTWHSGLLLQQLTGKEGGYVLAGVIVPEDQEEIELLLYDANKGKYVNISEMQETPSQSSMS